MEKRLSFIETTIREKLSLGQTLDEAEIALREIFSKDDVTKAIESLKTKDPSLSGEVTPISLSENLSYLGWYSGPTKNPDSHWNLLKNHLSNKNSPWSKEMITGLDYASNSVLEHLVPPKSKYPLIAKGLVLGYIQSGKTANFSAVIAKAVDQGYRLVVVLSGMHNNLRLQTQARLMEEIVEPKEEACITLTRVDEKGDFDKKQTLTANRALGNKDGFSLVVLKKNTHVLRAFNNWLTKAKPDYLANCPTLIIDDESDQASVNTNKPENDPTAINSKIRELIQHFEKVSYVGYTATPFANILIDGSEEQDIYPKDFFISLEKPPTYFGPEELFGRMGVNGDDEKKAMPVLRSIPEIETLDEEDGVIPESLKKAIVTYILSATLRLFRGQREHHITMLVHTSHLMIEHNKYYNWINEYIKELILDFIDIEDKLPIIFKDILNNDHKITSQFIIQSNITENLNIKKFIKEIKNFLEKIEIILENSTSSDRLSFDRVEPLWGIIIGGNTLSRGLTIEGLTVSYFERNTKQYDTLLQMGRWFGYRNNYADLTRIFLTDKMREYFFNLATVEQEIRDEIESMSLNNERPIDVAIRVRSFPGLKITSANKMRNVVQSSISFSGSKIQLRSILKSKSIIKGNSNAVERLLNQINEMAIKEATPPFEEWSKALLYKKVPTELILQFLEVFKMNTQNIKYETELGLQYITDLNKADELTEWSVCLMSSKSGRSHILESGKEIFCVKRSPLLDNYKDYDHITLKSLVPPLNEIIDLTDVLPLSEMTTSTVFSSYMKKMNLTDTKIRKDQRPKERGLILIYPIDPSINENGAGDLPLYTISLVFPSSKNDLGFKNYYENETITGELPSKKPKAPLMTKSSETPLKVLNIAQPNAHCVFFKGKNIENRSRKVSFKGTVLIYASKTINNDRFDGSSIPKEDCSFGCILGSVDLVDCITKKQATGKYEEWFDGPYGYALENIRVFDKPIPVTPPKGAVIWWSLEGDDLKNAKKQIGKGNITPLTKMKS
jgi:hypothetical protein